jgi:hypothetical protein
MLISSSSRKSSLQPRGTASQTQILFLHSPILVPIFIPIPSLAPVSALTPQSPPSANKPHQPVLRKFPAHQLYYPPLSTATSSHIQPNFYSPLHNSPTQTKSNANQINRNHPIPSHPITKSSLPLHERDRNDYRQHDTSTSKKKSTHSA